MTNIKFIVGETYCDFIKVLKRTDKTITVYRTDKIAKGDNVLMHDREGEHAYRVHDDIDGDEYVVIDRFTSYNREKFGKCISANRETVWYLLKI